jgi:hypothetical protein
VASSPPFRGTAATILRARAWVVRCCFTTNLGSHGAVANHFLSQREGSVVGIWFGLWKRSEFHFSNSSDFYRTKQAFSAIHRRIQKPC